MIEVRHCEHNSKLSAQFEQETQQSHGVGATRHGDSDAVARAEQRLFANVAKNLLPHDVIVREAKIIFTTEDTEQRGRQSDIKSTVHRCLPPHRLKANSR